MKNHKTPIACKRLLAWLLCLAMAVGMLPTAAFAQENSGGVRLRTNTMM